MCIIPRSQTPWCASNCRARLHSVHHTVGSDSAGCITQQSHENKVSKNTPRSEFHHRVRPCVFHTAESIDPNFSKNSTVCIIPQCASQCGVKLRNVHHTAESNCTWQSLNQKFNWSLVAFKGTIRKNPLRSEHFYHERKDLKYKSGFT